MSKSIDTLVSDIYDLLLSKETNISQEDADAFGKELSQVIVNKLTTVRADPYLRLSNLGSDCDRELYYKINKPELEEALPPEAILKFLFGDILEVLLLFLAKQAGHTVEGRQDKADVHGVKGSRDAVIDGCLVDAKSASTYSFRKFEDGTLEANDPFGYVIQLNAYLEAAQTDPLVKVKDKAYFFVIDKTLGHLCLSPIKRKPIDWKKYTAEKKAMLDAADLPVRKYMDVAEGKSGNMKLGVKCSYCAFKKDCWPKMRTFLYSSGPVFLTKVAREPNVPEVK